MCGIIAVVRRRSSRTPPRPAGVLSLLEAAPAALTGTVPGPAAADDLNRAAAALEEADRLLRGVPGVRCLLAATDLLAAGDRLLADFTANLARLESDLDAATGAVTGSDLERVNVALVRAKDAAWAIRNDRLRTARAVADLAGPTAGPAAIEAFMSVQVALSALDRLEVRGRDSAGIHLLVRDHGLDLDSIGVRALLDGRATDPLFRSRAVRTPEGFLSFVYKAAAEIGELGDNSRHLRSAIVADDLLRLALTSPDAEMLVVGHTRWASVGIISEANAHPLNSEEDGDGQARPYVIAALNGDVDNYADLKSAEGLRIAAEITTDAKVIPALVSRRLAEGIDLAESFRRTVAAFEGSVAIAAHAAADPGRVLLAQRGSGQSLYVGLAEDTFIVASEPYGLVEETARYIRMDGETPADPDNPTGSRGQILVLDGRRAGSLDGITRLSYDGSAIPVSESDVATAQITTRDIDRGPFPHFLLKEINEAPASFRKTLRGKLVGDGDSLRVELGSDALPARLRERLGSGAVNRIVAIGQGTAAVAAQSFAAVLSALVADTGLRVAGSLGTELSGFGLRPDMSDTLVVAISQSGTTTDTNRTVDLVQARGASVVAIVNRRNSDLTDRADGVLYTSDGRDVEMSVASTKAFYSQVAAGCLLAVAVAEAAGVEAESGGLLEALRTLPDAMARTILLRPEIASIAQQFAPHRRYWAIVGNGVNRIAAQELRIKLSELCYKAIAFDSTEDKKHIDLSSEPMILVCAAGLSGSNADDVAKEVAIFRAHKAVPIVIVTEGEDRYSAAMAAIKVPETDPRLAFVLSAMAGHLFGYEAALAIDAQARLLREARAAIESAIASDGWPDGDRMLRELVPRFQPIANRFFDGLRAGAFDGHLEASTAVRLASLLRYALGVTPLEAYQAEHGKIGTPAVVVEDLTSALTRAIEELTRPVDAIKHQAKTVTVGISRSDETLLQVPLVAAALAAGASRDRLSYHTLRTLAGLDPAVAEVTGSIRYTVEAHPDDEVTAVVVERAGIARDVPSRVERNPLLRGTKHTIYAERQPLAFVGGDGRTLVGLPEVKDNQTTGITLLHVRFRDYLTAAGARTVLQGYRNRFSALKDAVTEFEPTFREDILAQVPVVELLTAPIHVLARRWRS